jgi:hypothetical protein
MDGNVYFLEENKNWKVIEINEESIYMLPNYKAPMIFSGDLSQ